jgi:hypothetical protein
MIVLDLSCAAGHRFEAWFRSAGEFSSQAGQGLVACPVCGTIEVRRLPSAVHVAAPVRPATAPATMTPPSPAALARALVNLLAACSEDVGRDFAEEARRIHYREAPERTIRGQATEEEREALQDEGIEVVVLPRIEPGDLN